MSGYQTVLRFRRIEEEITSLGFRWGNSKRGSWGDRGYDDIVALYPADDALPVYARDAELFVGSIEELEIWLRGFRQARDYDYMLFGKSIVSKRERKEQDIRNRRLLNSIRDSKLDDGPMGGSPNGV